MRTVILTGVFCIALTGCHRHDEITRYSIAVATGPDVQLAGERPNVTQVAAGAPSRMLGAIIPRGQQTWFLKLTGPDEAVVELQAAFESLVQSLKFANQAAPPTWELPSGWKQLGPSGMRLATIEIRIEDQTLELTVIPLQTRGELPDYLLANVNRWRAEVGLNSIASLDSDLGGIRQMQLPDSTPVTLVNLVGQGAANHVSMGGNHPPAGDASFNDPPPADDVSFTYSIPKDWQQIAAAGMRRAAFEVVQGEEKAEITVITLPVSGGERLSNVNRWREQVGLTNITIDQLTEELQQIGVGDMQVDYVEMFGPEAQATRKAILAGMVDVNTQTWFFKLMGHADLAAMQREQFKDFVRSAKISQDPAGDDNE